MRNFLSKKNSKGLGLLELMLVMVIAALIIIFGIKQASRYQQTSRIQLVIDHARALLSAGGDYYYANCLRNPLDYDTWIENDKLINNTSILSQMPGELVNFPNYFGSFNTGPLFNNPGPSFDIYLSGQTIPQNQFGSTWLWQVDVETCITDPGLLSLDPQTLRGLFDADFISPNPDASCGNGSGKIIIWIRLPRSTNASSLNANAWVLKAGLAEYNQQYRFGHWMLDPNNGVNPAAFGALCQY